MEFFLMLFVFFFLYQAFKIAWNVMSNDEVYDPDEWMDELMTLS